MKINDVCDLLFYEKRQISVSNIKHQVAVNSFTFRTFLCFQIEMTLAIEKEEKKIIFLNY